jgi:hypothetical protein
LVKAAIRRPKLAIAVLLLVLAVLAGTLSYTGYLVVGAVAGYLGTSRVMAGLLLGVLFARLPWVVARKLRTIGLLPKRARLPVMVALLAFCLLSYSYRGEWIPVLFLTFAGAFLVAYPRIRKTITERVISSLFKPSVGPNHSKSADDNVIDGEFREKKD